MKPESDPLGDDFLDSLLDSGALAINEVPQVAAASGCDSRATPKQEMPPEGRVWGHTASAALGDLIDRTLIIAVQPNEQGHYKLVTSDGLLLHQAVRDWIGQAASEPSTSDSLPQRVIDELLQAAQRSRAPAWATCLPNGQPLVIASTDVLQVSDRASLVREMHHRALLRLRELSIDVDQRALSSYEEGEPQ